MVTSTSQLNKNINEYLRSSKVLTRPNASHGLWIASLLPVAFCLCGLKFFTSSIYKYAILQSICLFISSWLFIISIAYPTSKIFKWNGTIISVLLSTFFTTQFTQLGLVLSVIICVLMSISFKYLIITVLKKCRQCFTLGEALVVTQCITLFVFTTFINMYESFLDTPYTDHDIITIILQVGLLTVFFVILTLYQIHEHINLYRFCFTVSCYIILMLGVLHMLLKQSPVLWIILFVLSDLKKIIMIGYWVAATILGIVTVNSQISTHEKASTSQRKIFHILSVAVYVPGLLYECDLIYLASGIALAALLALETIRKLNLGWFSDILNGGFNVFSDEKELGGISVTPIYLLLGIAGPIFIHPAPCNGGPVTFLALISGLLSVGIGDTVASFFGSRYGKTKWPDSEKSMEGSVANVVSQIIFVILFSAIGLIPSTFIKIYMSIMAVLINSMVEAVTDQVDNLTLPLITFIVLIL